jgi:hypothetical protein
MKKRWLAAGMAEDQRSFRRVIGYKLALERREVERAIDMARPARAREHSIGEDIAL